MRKGLSAQNRNHFEKINTTLGELVEAVTHIALQTGQTPEEGYELASMALENILRRNSKDLQALTFVGSTSDDVETLL